MKQTQVPKPISFGCPWIPLNALDAACQIRYPTTAKRRGVARREHRNSSITHCMFWLLPKANRISWPTSSSTYLLVLGRITFPRRFFISLSTKELIRAWTTRSPRRTPLAISAPRRTSSSRAWPLLIAACTPHGWVPPKGTGTSLIYSNLPYLWLSMVCLLATFWAPAQGTCPEHAPAPSQMERLLRSLKKRAAGDCFELKKVRSCVSFDN